MRAQYLTARGAVMAVGLVLTAIPGPAAAEDVYWNTRTLLGSFFADSEKVTYEVVETAESGAKLAERLGYRPSKERYAVFIATTGERVDGYAVIDDEVGQHRPITIGTQISPDGAVVRTEVMAYREPYGDEIRAERFRRQFHGKKVDDSLRLGRDVAAISGATISARSMTVAVRRALALVDLVRERTAAAAAAPTGDGGSEG